MKNSDLYIGVTLLLLSLGINYFSRFLLRNYPKMTGDELKVINSKLEGIHQTHLVLSTITFLSVAFFAFLIYQANPIIWKERAFLLFTPVLAIYALFDGLFAINTNVFPATTRYKWNSFVYDKDQKLRWVALWQSGLSIILMVVDFVVFVTLS